MTKVRPLPRGRAGKRPSIIQKLNEVLRLAEMYAYAGKDAMFKEALTRDFGIPEGSDQYEAAMTAFREMRAHQLQKRAER